MLAQRFLLKKKTKKNRTAPDLNITHKSPVSTSWAWHIFFHFLSAVVRVDGGPQPDTPPPEVWGRGGSVRAEDRERRVGTWTVDGKRNRGEGWGWGGTLECKTDWFICEVATEQRLDSYGPPSTFGPHFDSSSLHIESNSIYQCAWTQPLWQYQPLSVPVSLEIHNHRYMPVQLVLTDYSSI